ncbi:jg2001 [Pararge aegeria aegeria]|uniref:Jg2001 protein n=1 Tax=Pararge aegeria aegeria TaxID=348720 RepID=A0A8S4S6C4_9NEOP|nr:jg2001 [Pararge aegeria aegeria]
MGVYMQHLFTFSNQCAHPSLCRYRSMKQAKCMNRRICDMRAALGMNDALGQCRVSLPDLPVPPSTSPKLSAAASSRRPSNWFTALSICDLQIVMIDGLNTQIICVNIFFDGNIFIGNNSTGSTT